MGEERCSPKIKDPKKTMKKKKKGREDEDEKGRRE